MHPKPIHRSLISLGFSAPAVIWAGVAAALAVAVPSQAPAGMLLADLSRHLLPVDGADTAAVVYGDWDADGDLDLFCGNTGGMSAVFINTGGFFSDETAQRWPTVVEWTQCVAAADVDGDGDLDIVCGNAFEGYAWWYAPNSLFLNDGSGVFTAAPSGQLPQVSDITRAIAMGDVDGDGDFDLICGNGYAWHGEQNRLLLNNGSGTFVDVTSSHLPVQADAT